LFNEDNGSPSLEYGDLMTDEDLRIGCGTVDHWIEDWGLREGAAMRTRILC